MPDLGKAVYTLVLNTAGFDAGLAESEARTAAATNAIAGHTERASVAIQTMGPAAVATAGTVGVATGQMAMEFEGVGAAATVAAEQTVVAAGEIGAAATTAAAETSAAGAKAQGGWSRIGSTLTGIGEKFKGMGAKMGHFGRGLRMKVTLPILAVGGIAAKMAYDFNESFTKISALVGASGSALDVYKKKVLDLSGKTAEAPKELADALYFITSSGFKGASALKVLTAVAKATEAGLGDMSTVADAVTSAVYQFGEANLSAARATDILFATVREGKMEPQALSESIGRIIPITEAMGIQFGEMSGMLAGLSLGGLDASEGVTALRGTMASFLKPTKDAHAAVEKYGMTMDGLRKSIREKGLMPVLQHLRDTLSETDEAAVFGNIRAYTGFINLTGKNSARNAALIQKVNGAIGDTDKAVKKVQATPEFKLKKAINDLRLAAIKLGAIILPVLVKMAGGISRLVGWFQKLSPETKKIIGIIMLLAAAIGPIIGIAVAVAAAFAAWPFVLIVAGIAALVTGLSILYVKSETFRKIMGAVVEVIKGVAKGLWRMRYIALLLAAPFVLAAILIIRNWKKISGVFQTVWEKMGILRKVVRLVVDPFIDAARIIIKHWDGIKMWLDNFTKHLEMLFTDPLEAIKLLWGDMKAAVVGIIKGLWDWVKIRMYKIVLAILEPLSKLPWKFGEKAREAKEALLKNLKGIEGGAEDIGTRAGRGFSKNFLDNANIGIDQVRANMALAMPGGPMGPPAPSPRGPTGPRTDGSRTGPKPPAKRTATFVGNGWVETKTGKPLNAAGQKEAWAAALKIKPNGPFNTGMEVPLKPIARKPPKPKVDKPEPVPGSGDIGLGGDKFKDPDKDPKNTRDKPKPKLPPLIPLRLEVKLAQAQRKTPGDFKDDLRALQAQRRHLRGLIDSRKLHGQRLLDAERLLAGVNKDIGATMKKLKKAVDPKELVLWTPAMRTRLAKAKRNTPKNLKDDIGVLKAEEGYLRKLLKAHKGHAKIQAVIQEELTRVHLQRLALQKKHNEQLKKENEEKKKAAALMFALYQENAGFFGSFGANVFQGDAGQRTPGTGAPVPPPATPQPPTPKPPSGGKTPPAFATGGIVPGRGNKDTTPILATPGEAVIRPEGLDALRAVLGSRAALAEVGQPSGKGGGTTIETFENHQHFLAPTPDRNREARLAYIAARAASDGGFTSYDG